MSPKALPLITCLALMAVGAWGQNFSLTSLPYSSLDALEPVMSIDTVLLHWTGHTYAYVQGLNNALAKCPELEGMTIDELVQAVGVVGEGALNATCAVQVRNMAGGVYNHYLFFYYNLAAYGNQTFEMDASPELQAAVDAAFGSFEGMQRKFNYLANTYFGVGWVFMCVDPVAQALNLVTVANQDNPLHGNRQPPCLPILSLDMWEHAYYLDYQLQRSEYVEGFWDIINWRSVSDLYALQRDGEAVDLLAFIRP